MNIITAMYIKQQNTVILRLQDLDVYIDESTIIRNFRGTIHDIVKSVRLKKLNIDKIKYDCYFEYNGSIRRVHYIRFSNI